MSCFLKPKVCVLLAAHNGSNWISDQIDTIFLQHGVDISLFISVDLSQDDSYELCLKKQFEYKNLFILPYGQRYGSAAKNFYRLICDVDFSGYDYVSLADQDDIWLSDKLFDAISSMREFSCHGYSSDVFALYDDSTINLIVKSQPQKKFDYLFESGGPGCTYVLTAESFLSLKRLLLMNVLALEFRSHDWLIYAFYRSQGLSWHISSGVHIFYRQHSNNCIGVNKGLKAYKKRFYQIINKSYRRDVENLVKLLDHPHNFKFSFDFMFTNFLQLRRRTRDAFILLTFIFIFS